MPHGNYISNDYETRCEAFGYHIRERAIRYERDTSGTTYTQMACDECGKHWTRTDRAAKGVSNAR